MAHDIAKIVTAQDIDWVVGSEVNLTNLGQIIRALVQNWRQGTVACKGRADVAFSNKKPWKQKGTGRARAGSPRSPLWRKGGVTFGPQERTRVLKISKNSKRLACADILNLKLHEHSIVSFTWALQNDSPKTSVAYKALETAGLAHKKVILFVQPHDFVIQASFANLPNVSMIYFDQPNAYALAEGTVWAFFEKDADQFKKMVSSWK